MAVVNFALRVNRMNNQMKRPPSIYSIPVFKSPKTSKANYPFLGHVFTARDTNSKKNAGILRERRF